jgi:hypothetical protein
MMTARRRTGEEGMRGHGALLTLLVLTTCVCSPTRLAAFPLLAQNWRELSPSERYDTLKNYQQHERLPEERQHDVEKRYERWQQMSPDERNRIRQNYERLRQLPPQERARIQQKYEKWRRQAEPSH